MRLSVCDQPRYPTNIWQPDKHTVLRGSFALFHFLQRAAAQCDHMAFLQSTALFAFMHPCVFLHPLLYVGDAMVHIRVCFTSSHLSIVSHGIHWRTYFIMLHFFFSALQVPHSTSQPPPTLTPTNSIPFPSCPRCFPLLVCRSPPLAHYWCHL